MTARIIMLAVLLLLAGCAVQPKSTPPAAVGAAVEVGAIDTEAASIMQDMDFALSAGPNTNHSYLTAAKEKAGRIREHCKVVMREIEQLVREAQAHVSEIGQLKGDVQTRNSQIKTLEKRVVGPRGQWWIYEALAQIGVGLFLLILPYIAAWTVALPLLGYVGRAIVAIRPWLNLIGIALLCLNVLGIGGMVLVAILWLEERRQWKAGA